MRQIRLFVSSPSDVAHERLRVDRVVQRLNGEFAEVAQLQAIRWETEFYQAHATFQAQIPLAEECEIVIAIFRGRLGTELPPEFARMPDGPSYPSGTAYEVLTAMTARREKGKPDVYVFRHTDPPTVRLDDPNAGRIEAEWRRLKQFFDTWFLTQEGHFTGAFHTFGSTDDFDAQLSRLLRGWLEDKVLRGRAVAWPIEVLGSPFRGLAAFGAKHAPVFFGRSRDISRAADQWKHAAEGGYPFLLVVGASGAGKSSLARAGLIPRLTASGVVPTVDLWRVAALRPSEIPGGPIMTLATRLLDQEADIPEDEKGRPLALPELAEGDYRDVGALAALFRQAPDISAAPILRALDRVGAAVRNRHSYDRPVRVDLVLLIDQLDELFASYVDPAERVAFARLLELLVDSGRVWVIATLRADLYALYLADPALLALKGKGASYDVVAPGRSELAEIVRRPAEAAGLAFEIEPGSGERLDDKLLREADRPDMLPLLQLMLNRLFENRAEIDGEIRLTFAAERELGGLAGVVDREGERALEGLDEEAIAALPRLLRRLAAVGRNAGTEPTGTSPTVTARTVSLSRAADTEAARRLIDALIDARLLLTSGEGGEAGIRLAHERVLTDWARARELVAANAEFYRIRAEIEEAQRRWETAQRSHDLLIPRGLPLAEAEATLGGFGDELAPAGREFIALSGRRARRRQRRTQAAAVMFAVLTVAATAVGIFAEREQRRAERSLAAAKGAVGVIVRDVAHGFRNVQGIRTDKIRTVLEHIQQTVDGLKQEAPSDPAIARLDLEMLDQFAVTYFTVNDLERAHTSAADALSLARRLATEHSGEPDGQRNVAVVLTRIGAIELRRGDPTAALKADQDGAEILEQLLAKMPGNALWRQDLATVVSGIGDVRMQMGDASAAGFAYQRALTILRQLAEGNPEDLGLRQSIAEDLNKLGDIELHRGEHAAAIANYQESLAITRGLTLREPGNTQWQRDLFVALTRIGDLKLREGQAGEAVSEYQGALALMRRLADADRGNPQMLWDLASTLLKIGDAKLEAGERESRSGAYEEALGIMRRLAESDRANTLWQRDLAVSLNKVGDVKLLNGDTAGANATYEEALSIAQQLVARDPDNAVCIRDLAVSLDKSGDLKLRVGNAKAAITDYQQALSSALQLSQRDPANTSWQRDIAVTLNKIGDAKVAIGDVAEAVAEYEQALRRMRRLADTDENNTLWQSDIAFTLSRIGDAKARLNDISAVKAALRERLEIVRRLVKHDTARTALQVELAASLYRLARIETGSERDTALREALAILEPLQSQTKLTADQSSWPGMIRAMLDSTSREQ